MRKILFRGKEIDTGKWAYGNYYYEEKNRAKPHYITWNGKDALGDFGDRYHPVHNVTVDPATVGQFTGLCDKNGAKIFEGDIVKDILGHVGQIVYKEKHSAFVVDEWWCGYALWFKKEIEVIGNIFDTPKLLEKVEE